MEKLKIFIIIFAICFVLMMSGGIMRVSQYGLYGSKEVWEKTVSIPPGVNYPNGTSESDAIIKYGAKASEYLTVERNLITEIKEMETNGFIKCYPDQYICHYTGKGFRPYGSLSDWEQSSDYNGWLSLILTNFISAIILSAFVYLIFEIIQTYKKKI